MCLCIIVMCTHELLFTAETDPWRFSVSDHGMHPTPCLITLLPFPSLLPFTPSCLSFKAKVAQGLLMRQMVALFLTTQRLRHSLQQTKVIFFLHYLPPSLTHFLSPPNPLSPPKCFSLLIRAHSSNWSSTSSPILAKPVISGYYLL